MAECLVCHGKHLREELVDKVFDAGGRYVLVARDAGNRLPRLRRAVFQPRGDGESPYAGPRPAGRCPRKVGVDAALRLRLTGTRRAAG